MAAAAGRWGRGGRGGGGGAGGRGQLPQRCVGSAFHLGAAGAIKRDQTREGTSVDFGFKLVVLSACSVETRFGGDKRGTRVSEEGSPQAWEAPWPGPGC